MSKDSTWVSNYDGDKSYRASELSNFRNTKLSLKSGNNRITQNISTHKLKHSPSPILKMTRESKSESKLKENKKNWKFVEDFDEDEEEKTLNFSEIKLKESIKKRTPWNFALDSTHHPDAKFNTQTTNSLRPKSAKDPKEKVNDTPNKPLKQHSQAIPACARLQLECVSFPEDSNDDKTHKVEILMKNWTTGHAKQIFP